MDMNIDGPPVAVGDMPALDMPALDVQRLRLPDLGAGSLDAWEKYRDSAIGFIEGMQHLPTWVNRHTMIAVTTMMLVAESYGFDTAPMEGFNAAAVKTEFGVPEEAEVVALLAIGRGAAPEKAYPGRFPLDTTTTRLSEMLAIAGGIAPNGADTAIVTGARDGKPFRKEVDIALSLRAELAQEVQNTPGLTLKPTVGSAPYWLYFPEQWDAKSPWHDIRVRQAANLALDRDTINQALTLGHSHITGSVMPENFASLPKDQLDSLVSYLVASTKGSK